MTPVRLALAELRRLTSGRMAKIALAALVLIPSLYGGLYLYANKDPYGGMSRVPAAIVDEDQGTTLSTGEPLKVGPQVASTLVDSKSFDWHEVTRSDAEQGVRDGTYDFAIIVPAGFSGDLASSTGTQPRQATLELATNDANNYMARTIANQVVAQVTKSVAAQVTSTAANQMLVGFTTIHDKVSQAADGAGTLATKLGDAKGGADKLVDGANQLVDGEGRLVDGSAQVSSGASSAASASGQLANGATQLSAGAAKLDSGASSLASGLGQLDSQSAALPKQTRQLADGAQQVADGNAKIAAVSAQLVQAGTDLRSQLQSQQATIDSQLKAAGVTDAQLAVLHSQLGQLTDPVDQAAAKAQATNQQLQALSAGSTQVAQGAQQLATAAPQLQSGIHQAATGASQVRTGAQQLDSGAAALSTGATKLQSGLGTLSSGAAQLHDGTVTARNGAVSLRDGLVTLDDGLGQLQSGATQLHDGLTDGLSSIPNPSQAQREAVAQTLGNPVGVATSSDASAANYGTGLAPFFMSLALWIGAYVLFLLVRPLSARALAANAWPVRVALGGWGAPALIGSTQALVLYLVITRALNLEVVHPWGVLGLMVLASMTFVAIVQLLAARLGAVGKFLGLVLLVVQLVSSGGTFPWQTLPEPLHPLHEVLPMSWAIEGARSLMYGGDPARAWAAVAVLSAYLVGALVLTSVTARSRRVWTPSLVKPEISL